MSDDNLHSPVTEPMPKEKRAEVSYAEPVAWAVVSDSTEQIDCEFIYADEATAGDVALDGNGAVVPLYRHTPCQVFSQKNLTLTDAEREAIKEASEFYIGTRTGVALRGLLGRL